MLTIPFDLSKRFGPVIEKMGGETSFRIEMSDPFVIALLLFISREIFVGLRPGIRIPKVTYLWVLVIAMGVWAIISGPWRTTASQEVVRMCKLTVLFIVVANELNSPKRVLQCVAALTVAVMIQAVVGLIQFTWHKHLGLELMGETSAGTLDQLAAESVMSEKAFRAGAFLSHPNLFGIFLAALIPLSIGVFLLRTGKVYKTLFLAGTMLGGGALVTTLSRSGWLSFGVAFTGLIGLMVLHEKLRRQSLVTAAGAALALAVVCVVFAGPISRRLFESKESAMLSRSEYIHDAMGLIWAKPLFGWGINSYVYAAPPFTRYGARGAHLKYKQWLPPVHNIYLLWWAELGIVGLAIQLAMLGGILFVGIRNMRVQDERMYAVNAACLAGMLALMTDGFFSFSLRFNSILRVFWVIAGIIMAIHYWRLKHEVATDELRVAAEERRRKFLMPSAS
jgi:O-antigen ligase